MRNGLDRKDQRGSAEQKPAGGTIPTGVRITQPVLARLQTLHLRFVRGIRNGRKVVLRRCDMSGLDFTDMDFRSAELLACDFSKSKMQRTDFRFAMLFAGNFDDADLSRADFQKADLRASTFERANLTRAKMEGADLRNCAFMDEETSELGDVISSTFRGAMLRRTNMVSSKLKSANFNGAVLDHTDLTNADMRATRFQGAEFVQAKLSEGVVQIHLQAG
ncbi:MAG: pentapeptide repeat-containing protein, partial [Kiloniellaceae bacterium]